MAPHSHGHTKPMSATNLCSSMNNSFLMGGVDKRRYRRKPKGLMYRIFWSSLPRRLFVSFVMLYLAVFHVLAPIGEWILSEVLYTAKESYNTRKTNKAILEGLVHGPRFDQLPSIKQERNYLTRLAFERDTLKKTGSKSHQLPEYWQILEQIVPEWFHRFDSDIVHIKTTHKNQKHNQENTKHANGEKLPIVNADDGGDDKTSDKKENTNADEATHENNELSGKGDIQHKSSEIDRIPSIISKKANTRYQKEISGTSRHLTVKGGIYIAEDADANEPGAILPLRTLDNMYDLGANFSSCDASQTPTGTTLVVQTSIDRMWILQETCSRWSSDPIVATVFVPHSSSNPQDEEQILLTELETTSQKLLKECPNLTLVRYEADHIESLQGRYPVNRLRNVALDLVQTSHVLMMDVDFVPSRDLARLVGAAIQSSNESGVHRALVVPAFEKKAPKSCNDSTEPAKCMSNFLKDDSSFLPQTFEELQECNEEKECVVFQSEFNWDGHSTTDSGSWIRKVWYEETKTDASEKRFKTIPCFHTARYEPYVVIEWCPITNNSNDESSPISPYYDERFYGYGKNKIQLISHLRRSNTKFEILPEGFLVHNPHPESSTKETWLNKDHSNDLHATMDALYSQFMAELDVKYKDVHEDSVKICERHAK